ncbi:MAG: bifunctional diguanylate cyclase/phosphodiesterase [Gammaproteobacteria bacterium]|nr:bifunctional diguanylate cyclase/phosphodiesterase [Gammaproteobacteria bacterium]
MRHLRSEVLRLDEVLTMSASMAATTGNLYWSERYYDTEPKLSNVLNGLNLLADKYELAAGSHSTEEANVRLIEIELAALNAVHEGDLEKATELLFGNEYDALKKRYLQGMASTLDAIELLTEDLNEKGNNAIINLSVFGISGLILIALSWFGFAQAHKRWMLEVNSRQRELRHSNLQLAEASSTDPITGVANRRLIIGTIDEALTAAPKNDCAVINIDIDNFKRITDALGQNAANDVMKLLADRLYALTPPNCSLGSLGGDHFALFCEHYGRSEAIALAEHLLHEVRQPVYYLDHTLNLTASLGIVLIPTHADNGEDALHRAEVATRRAKQEGRDCIRLYHRDTTISSVRQLAIETRLRSAIEQGSLSVHYQPIVCLKENHLVGAEALLRWQDEELGNVGPAEFVPIAESLNLTSDLASLVFNTAWKDARETFQKMGTDEHPFKLAINCSAQQLTDKRFLSLLLEGNKHESLNHVEFELELTERLLVQSSPEVHQNIERLIAAGYKLSLDDFGTGYSALNYLQRYPFNTVKIDRSFVKNLPSNTADSALCKAIIGMAKALDMTTVAEGLEQEEQIEHLYQLGAEMAQGFYYARPLPVLAFREWQRDFVDTNGA